MMKRRIPIVYMISFIALCFVGCKRSPTSDEPPASAPEAPEAPIEQALDVIEDGTQLVEPKIADAWVDAMDDTAQDAKQRYDDAFALLRWNSGENAQLLVKHAVRLGDWVVVRVDVDDTSNGDASIVLLRHAYVVDLANHRLVSRDGWREVIGFYRAIYQRFAQNRAFATSDFVDNMARFSAAVAAENSEIYIPVEGDSHPEIVARPALRIAGEDMVLTWFSANSATPPMYISYVLTYRNGSLNFVSEIVEPEPPIDAQEIYELK